MIEPAVIAENRPMVISVLMRTQVWRCAPEQLRRASNQEVTIAELFNVNLKKMQPKVWTNGERERERGGEGKSKTIEIQDNS